MSLFDLEECSFDIVTEGGDILGADFTACRLAGAGRFAITVRLLTADGRDVRDSLTARLPLFRGHDRGAFRNRFVEAAEDGCRVSLDLPLIRLELRYVSAGEWRPNGSGILLTRGTRVFRWLVPQFRASVSGFLALGSEEFDVRGSGFQDIVRTNIPPWRQPVRELLRGRAHFPSTTLVFQQLTTGQGTVTQNILVKRDPDPQFHPPLAANGSGWPRLRWIEDYAFQVIPSDRPGEAVISHPAFTLALKEKRVLENGAIPPPPGVLPAPLMKALNLVRGWPEKRKVLSEACLSMSGHEERGLAVHERQVWRVRPRS